MHISTESLDWALTHVKRFGDTDIFPVPFEYAAIEFDWDTIKQHLSSADLDTWQPRSKRTSLTPKGKYAYRISTQLDPLDTLLFLALVYEIGSDLEKFRISAADQIVLSHRFSPTAEGQLYDSESGWVTFVARSTELAKQDEISHVVIADISDFYPRLYQHRIQNTLRAATSKPDHVRVLMKLFNQWSGGDSYGIPVGPSASRLIADVAIDDIDQYMLAEGSSFCRYADDFRIFCTSYKDGYERLAKLADFLDRNHGLTLQQGKTSIVPKDTFLARYVSTPESEELVNLILSFHSLIEQLGLGSLYDQIDYDSLEPEQKEMIDRLNLEEILRSQLNGQDLDIGLTRFLLRRLGQLNDHSLAVELVEAAEPCYTVISTIVEYLTLLHDVPPDLRLRVGEILMGKVETSFVGHLPFHRSWLLRIFAEAGDWGQQDKFVRVYNSHPDSHTRRKAVLSMAQAGQFYWFRAGRETALDLEPWERRAFLYGASCLPDDERKFWYKSLRGRLDKVEEAVVKWAWDNPLAA